MPRTPKATDGEAPKKRDRKPATSADGSTKVTKTTKAAKSAKPTVGEEVAILAESAVQLANGESRVSPGPIEERIRLRAYELYLRRGGRGGSPEQDWFQAASEIYSESVA